MRTVIAAMMMLALCGLAAAGQVTVAWNYPAEELKNLGLFKIYWGTETGSYTSTVEVRPVTAGEPPPLRHTFELPAGRYFSALTAVGKRGLESGFSNEIVFTMPPPPPPIPDNYRVEVIVNVARPRETNP